MYGLSSMYGLGAMERRPLTGDGGEVWYFRAAIEEDKTETLKPDEAIKRRRDTWERS
jgi:hypothetical protein